MSLKYTIKGLDAERFEAVVALIQPTPAVRDFYEDARIRTIAWPGIATFQHTTAATSTLTDPITWPMLARTVTGWRSTRSRTRDLVRHAEPDLVHLNSVVLLPSAAALRGQGVPVVWHVREAPVASGRLRTAYMRHALRTWPDAALFLSDAEQNAWMGEPCGTVVPNFAPPELFLHSGEVRAVRASLGLPPDAPTVLYLGGLSEIKGIFPLLDAVALVRKRIPSVRLLMPGAAAAPSSRLVSKIARKVLPLVGRGTLLQRFHAHVARLGLQDTCVVLPFCPDPAPLYEAANVVVFPALEPHFARPIVEAGMMSRPVVSSRLPILSDLVVHGETGFLVTPGDTVELSDAVCEVLKDGDLAERLGQAGAAWARARFDGGTSLRRLTSVYETLLSMRSPRRTATAHASSIRTT